MVGVNQRIIEEQLAWKKQEYLNHGALEMIAELYESNKVISLPISKRFLYFGFLYMIIVIRKHQAMLVGS